MEKKKKGNNWGGIREGQGRPSKAAELKAHQLGAKAIISVYGSIDNYWRFIAEESMSSVPHLQLLHAYTYGKPVEKIDVTSGGNQVPIINILYAGSEKPNIDISGDKNFQSYEEIEGDSRRDFGGQDLRNDAILDSPGDTEE